MMRTQINRPINSAIKDRVVPDIQNKLETCIWTMNTKDIDADRDLGVKHELNEKRF